VISGFRRDIDEILDFLTLEDGTNMSRNVGKGLLFDAA
jgi:hypothetical protein